MKRVKFYGFTPITRRKISGYLIRFKKNSIFLFNGGRWQTVTKLFVEEEI